MTKKQIETEHQYACENCKIVSKHHLKKERVDQDYVAGTGSIVGRVGNKDQMNGYFYVRVCPFCGFPKIMKYVSDCKPGFCAKSDSHYCGGKPTNECPYCRNRFSHGTTYEDLDRVKS